MTQAQTGRAPDPLIHDFLTWLAERPRPYADVMDAWRTSCPRLTVFEDAVDLGLIERRLDAGLPQIGLTDAGRARLGH